MFVDIQFFCHWNCVNSADDYYPMIKLCVTSHNLNFQKIKGDVIVSSLEIMLSSNKINWEKLET